MTAYRIELSYIGTDFYGWQSQADGRAIQDYIERALEKILSKQVRILSASRTDSGVHAEHQVACLRIDRDLDVEKLRTSLEALIPESIGVLSIEKVADGFHPSDHAIGKQYRYQLWRGRHRDPFFEPFVWRIPRDIDVAKMQQASHHFIGAHDFTSFSASDSTAKSKFRNITKFDVVEVSDHLIACHVEGNAFLKQMIRTMVGTLVDCGMNRTSSDSIPTILAAKNRCLAGPTAPAKGLCLMNVLY